MRTNWLIMLVIAMIFGAAAVFVANLWLQQQTQQHARLQPAPAVETATIVIAADDLPFGKQLTAQDLKEIPWPKASIPNGYFAKISDITGPGQRVVLVPLSPNEPVLKWKISGPDQRGSLSAVVKAGMRAVSIRVNDIVGVAGFVLPGDRVDVLLTRNDKQSKEVTDVLLQDVKVLAVNQLANQKANEPTVAKVATLELSSVDAQKIVLAERVGNLTLSLRPAGSTERAPTRRIVEAELTSSNSAYEQEFAARKAAQEALDRRLKGLESNVAQLGKDVQATGSEAEKALNQRGAELRQRIADLQAELNKKVQATGSQAEKAMKQREAELKQQIADLQAELSKKVQATGSQAEEALKQQMAAVRSEIESKLRASDTQAQQQLRKQIATIQKELDDKLKASGKDDAQLRATLTELQDALQQSLAASNQGNESLRAKLVALEDKLRQLTGKATEPKVAEPAKAKIVDETMTVNVIRGLKVAVLCCAA